MAAGIGSRYGGVKQLAQVGRDGEAFLDFSIADAVSAGVSKVVLVVRSDIEDDVRRHVEARHDVLGLGAARVAYVRQDEHGPPRAKPWGTAHAAMCAAQEVSGPFMICNADDYYGESAFTLLAAAAAELVNPASAPVAPVGPAAGTGSVSDDQAGSIGGRRRGSQPPGGRHHAGEDHTGKRHTGERHAGEHHTGRHHAVLCGYRLGLTVPSGGAVSRGVCQVEGDRLSRIVEHHGVKRNVDGTITSAEPEAELNHDDIVSMNLWLFPAVMLDWIDADFGRFLASCRHDPSAEYILPEVVAARMATGDLSVSVVVSRDRWTGITNPSDLLDARAVLARRPPQRGSATARRPAAPTDAR